VLRFALSDKIHLRFLEPSDAEELHALVDANRARLSPWMPWAASQDLAATRTFIDDTRTQFARNDGFQTAVVEDGRIIGVIGFGGVDWPNRSTEIGYWIAATHEGRGIVTRGVRALVDHAFGAWELHRVEIQAAPENTRSQAVPLRLGFRREGVLRECELVGDRFLDGVIFSVLAADWAPDGR
jgi:ribosomal-protein-serine acetyltransferase